MDDALDFFLRGDPDTMHYQLVEVSHPSWTRTYRYVQNAVQGLTVTHEDGAVCAYRYSPINIKLSNTNDSLDQSITITVGDLGQFLPDDMDRLRADIANIRVKPVLNYREYLSTDLENPILTINDLKVSNYKPRGEGALFLCKAKEMNLTKTGIPYTIEKFKGLRDFI